MITRQEIENFIPGQWTLTDAKMQEIKALALVGFDSLVAVPLANVRRMADEIEDGMVAEPEVGTNEG